MLKDHNTVTPVRLEISALVIILFAYLFIYFGWGVLHKDINLGYIHLVHKIICKTDQLLLQKFDVTDH